MFELDGHKTWVDAQPGDVTYLATSINRPAVAPPDRSPEAAQSYICTLHQGGGYYVFIYLHLISSNTGILYRWAEGAVEEEAVESLKLNAQEFTESMGFMIDDLRFSELPPDQQAETFARTPLFHQDISFLKIEDESVTELEIVESGEGAEEVVIEAVEEDAPAESVEVEEAPAAPAEAEVEEITLDVMSADEIAPGLAESAPDQPAAPPAESEIALGGTLAEPAQAEEDVLLDQLEAREPSPAEPPPPLEPTPAPAPAMAEEEEASGIEISLDDDESSALLDALEAQAEEAPPVPAVPAAKASRTKVATAAVAEESIEVPLPEEPAAAEAPAAAAPAPSPASEGEMSADENDLLIRLLAMM